ncbi:MAG: twin-arginine translocation signal domain-containing protein, partial [Planctomycetota bacterium]
MSSYSRRDFIKASGSILGAGALGGSVFGCRPLDRARDTKNETPAPSEWGGFNYAMCNESMSEL